jgi:hypothetical protein
MPKVGIEPTRARIVLAQVSAEPIVYIDRIYQDPDEGPQPWPRRRAWANPGEEWQGGCDHGDHFEEGPGWDDVDAAVMWGRARARIVLVRLGTGDDTMYSAGAVRATEYVDGSGVPYPEWPPSRWPDYSGPCAEGAD